MTDQTALLDDTTATAIAAHVGGKSGHRVVGLHDDVMVREYTPARTFDLGWYSTSTDEPKVKIVERPTVEVILATPTGRIYAQRYRGSLDAFLAAAGVNVEAKAS